jgi:hypothetical protein
MATNKKITELSELTESDLANDDVLAIVDVSAGETFKVRKSTLASALAGVSSLAGSTPIAVDQGTGAVTVSIGTVPITSGGTGATSASAARTALGVIADPLTTRGDVVSRGASATQRLALGSSGTVLQSNGTDVVYGTVPVASIAGTLPLANGGTAATSASAALASLGAAARGSNSDITAITGLSTDLSIAQGGTGSSSASAARTALGLAIGSDVQAFDAQTALTDVDQTFTAANRGTITVDNDGSLDLAVTNNWKITPAANLTLTFTNISAANGQSGNIIFINSAAKVISLHANTKGDASLASTISVAGTYWLSYISDGTNVFVTTSAVFA